jgi:signal transduction histidine kinase
MSESKQASILLVDDDPKKRLALAAVLRSLGHHLFLAESGQEALRLAMQRDYAVILLDVQMPEMDGFETARLIHGRKRSAHTPIIFITAFDRADIDIAHGYAAGAVDYIFAPVIPEILCAKVNVFVELALMRQKLAVLNADLKRRAAELELANKELESFTYSVSHDLRAPLRAISGFSQILNEDYAEKLDDEGRRVLGVIRNNSRNMGELIDALLLFSRFNDKPVNRTEIDMTDVARAVFGETLAEAARAPEFRLSPLPKAWGDPALIRQVWVNLLSNAVKYSAKRAQPVIRVTGYAEGAEQIYCVKDNGAGFDMRYYDRLFGVFQRMHDQEEYPGTGVGLAIVQRVVGRHGGRVWAESKVDEGASFFFTLPTRTPADRSGE